MKLELLDLLNDYSKKGIYGDIKYITQIANILKKYQYNNLYFRCVQDANSDGRFFGDADDTRGVISIDIDFIKNYTFTYMADFDDSIINAYYVNMEIMKTMIHEFEHLMQSKKCGKLENDPFLNKLFEYSYRIQKNCIIPVFGAIKRIDIDEVKKVYANYHNCFVHERLAETRAIDLVRKIILPIKSETEQLDAWYFNSDLTYKIDDYYVENDILRCPQDRILSEFDITKYFLENKDYYDVNPDLFLKKVIDKFPFQTRLKYGLPITETEYNSCVDRINEANLASGNRGYTMSKIKILKNK